MVPPVKPLRTYDVAGAVGKLVGVIVTSVPTPAARALPPDEAVVLLTELAAVVVTLAVVTAVAEAVGADAVR